MLTNKSNAIVKIIYTNGDITGDALIFSVVTVGWLWPRPIFKTIFKAF